MLLEQCLVTAERLSVCACALQSLRAVKSDKDALVQQLTSEVGPLNLPL